MADLRSRGSSGVLGRVPLLLSVALLPTRLDAMCAPGVVVGIDLGTTTSAVAAVRDGLPEIVRGAAGKPNIP